MCKAVYKEDLEFKLKKGNLGSVWEGMHLITGQEHRKTNNKISLNGFSSDAALSQDFNNFLTRFDTYDFKQDWKNKCRICRENVSVPFDVGVVITVFKKSKNRKAPGPDNIGGRLLKECAEELGPIFYDIFAWSLQTQKVPTRWKQSTVISLPKKQKLQLLDDFRPVALT